MYLPVTSKTYLCIPITGPASAGDLTQYAVAVALMPDDGTEPGYSDWQGAIWIDGQAALLVNGGAPVSYPPGAYMAYATLTAGDETPVLVSGRVRVGDIRP